MKSESIQKETSLILLGAGYCIVVSILFIGLLDSEIIATLLNLS